MQILTLQLYSCKTYKRSKLTTARDALLLH